MFDLTTGTTTRMPRRSAFTVLLSSVFHLIALVAIVLVPILYATDGLPKVVTMNAFIVATPPLPPPPPPPPPPPSRPAAEPPARTAVASPDAAPVEAPSSVTPEPATPLAEDQAASSIEGGVTGGLVGGLVSGLQPPPPPPPPPAPPRGPMRIGGDIRPPVLVHRVEPIYPDIAASARVQGMVILEAVIDEEGAVQSVKVLRSVPLLDKAAVAAVEQWRYSPVMLNGKPVPVVLSVTVSFKLPT